MSTTTERKTLPPVTCQPWCTIGNGHPNEVFSSDQTCHSEEQAVPVPTFYPSIEGGSGVYISETVEVYTAQAPGSPARIEISLGGATEMLRMSLSEARSIAAALIAAADLAEGTH